MANVATEYKHLFLQGLMWDAEDQSLSLFAVLKSCARGKLRNTKDGRFIVGTAGNGRSTQFALPENSRINPESIASLCAELLRRYEEAVAYLEIDTPDIEDKSHDDDIFAAMKSGIGEPVLESSADFSGMNLGRVSA